MFVSWATSCAAPCVNIFDLVVGSLSPVAALGVSLTHQRSQDEPALIEV
jgi:hypothetical protein